MVEHPARAGEEVFQSSSTALNWVFLSDKPKGLVQKEK
jgi:hypothetical protein